MKKEPKPMKDQCRQGDTFLERISTLPELDSTFFKALPGIMPHEGAIVIALGESTGHMHKIIDNRDFFLRKSKNENIFFLVVGKSAVYVHDEHDPILIPPGTYQITQNQRQFMRGKIVRVAD